MELPTGPIFEVKGLIHPPGKAVAYPRYVPDPTGPRRKGRRAFRKLSSWSEKMAFLKGAFRNYMTFDPVLGDWFCEVPLQGTRVLDPREGLERLRKAGGPSDLARTALEMADEIRDRANLAWRDLGISGSLLVGLEGHSSDIDLMAYGLRACLEVYSALRAMREEGITRPLGAEELIAIYRARSEDTPYDLGTFLAREPNKLLQGIFKKWPYSIRLVPKKEREPYGAFRFKALGEATIRGEVVNASRSMLTPCSYLLADVEVVKGPTGMGPRSLVSFRLRFCEQAVEGELIEARGKLEAVLGPDGTIEVRLVVGGRPGDYFMPLRSL